MRTKKENETYNEAVREDLAERQDGLPFSKSELDPWRAFYKRSKKKIDSTLSVKEIRKEFAKLERIELG